MASVLKASKIFVGASGKRFVSGGAVASIPWGYLTSTTRDKRSIPFSETTCHALLAVGASATRSAAGITVESFSGYNTFLYANTVIWQPDETAPSLNLELSNGAWTGATRCNDDGATLQTVRCPTAFVVPGGAGHYYDNNTSAFLEPDGITLKQNQPFVRCVAGSFGTTNVTFSSISIYGDGLHGAHGGSDIGTTGTIIPGEFTSGSIRHGLNILLRASRYYYRDAVTPANMHKWPAFTHDGYALDPVISGGYGGTNANFKPGALLALPTSFSVAGLATVSGRIMAQALLDYGCRVVDDAFSNGIGFDLGRTPSLDTIDEFQSLYGYSFRAEPMTSGTGWANDMTTIVQALEIITNDTSTTIGGGGTRRQAAHSPIGN